MRRRRSRDALAENHSLRHLYRLWRYISDSWFHLAGYSCSFEPDSPARRACRALCCRCCSQREEISVAGIEESDQDPSVYRTWCGFCLETPRRLTDPCPKQRASEMMFKAHHYWLDRVCITASSNRWRSHRWVVREFVRRVLVAYNADRRCVSPRWKDRLDWELGSGRGWPTSYSL